MDDAGPTPPPPQNPLLRRRNHNSSSSSSSSSTTSSTTTVTSSSLSSSSSSQSDFELISIKPITYISLKDILPSTAVNSPRPMAHQAQSPGSEISIRNRLVKQAAWAYLQPMSASPESAGSGFLHRIFGGYNPFATLFRTLTSAFDWLLRAVRIRCSSRKRRDVRFNGSR